MRQLKFHELELVNGASYTPYFVEGGALIGAGLITPITLFMAGMATAAPHTPIIYGYALLGAGLGLGALAGAAVGAIAGLTLDAVF